MAMGEWMKNESRENHNLLIYADQSVDSKEAERQAERLHAALVRDWSEVGPADLVIRMDEEGIALAGDGMILRGDFTQMLPRLKKNNLQQELLVKAAKFKGLDGILTAVDATAGLGEDALLLAAAGFQVRLYEYDPVIALLLRDTLRRAVLVPELAEIAGRMELFEENSMDALQNLEEQPDLVLLDPMFPARQKSARIKKKFQLLQRLESPCIGMDEEALLCAAFAAEPRKIAVKRPARAICLAGRKPDYSIKSKVIRYDCFVLPRR